MPAPVLDQVASVWRNVVQPGGRVGLQEAISAVRCAIVPISTFDSEQAFAYESTHVIWVEYWLTLRKEDELRWGRRPLDAFGNVQPFVFVIKGTRRFRAGPTESAFYAREKD